MPDTKRAIPRPIINLHYDPEDMTVTISSVTRAKLTLHCMHIDAKMGYAVFKGPNEEVLSFDLRSKQVYALDMREHLKEGVLSEQALASLLPETTPGVNAALESLDKAFPKRRSPAFEAEFKALQQRVRARAAISTSSPVVSVQGSEPIKATTKILAETAPQAAPMPPSHAPEPNPPLPEQHAEPTPSISATATPKSTPISQVASARPQTLLVQSPPGASAFLTRLALRYNDGSIAQLEGGHVYAPNVRVYRSAATTDRSAALVHVRYRDQKPASATLLEDEARQELYVEQVRELSRMRAPAARTQTVAPVSASTFSGLLDRAIHSVALRIAAGFLALLGATGGLFWTKLQAHSRRFEREAIALIERKQEHNLDSHIAASVLQDRSDVLGAESQPPVSRRTALAHAKQGVVLPTESSNAQGSPENWAMDPTLSELSDYSHITTGDSARVPQFLQPNKALLDAIRKSLHDIPLSDEKIIEGLATTEQIFLDKLLPSDLSASNFTPEQIAQVTTDLYLDYTMGGLSTLADSLAASHGYVTGSEQTVWQFIAANNLSETLSAAYGNLSTLDYINNGIAFQWYAQTQVTGWLQGQGF